MSTSRYLLTLRFSNGPRRGGGGGGTRRGYHPAARRQQHGQRSVVHDGGPVPRTPPQQHRPHPHPATRRPPTQRSPGQRSRGQRPGARAAQEDSEGVSPWRQENSVCPKQRGKDGDWGGWGGELSFFFFFCMFFFFGGGGHIPSLVFGHLLQERKM